MGFVESGFIEDEDIISKEQVRYRWANYRDFISMKLTFILSPVNDSREDFHPYNKEVGG